MTATATMRLGVCAPFRPGIAALGLVDRYNRRRLLRCFAADHEQIHRACVCEQGVVRRTSEPTAPHRGAGSAENDLAGVAFAREGDQRGRHVLTGYRRRLGAEFLCETQRAQNPSAFRFRQALQRRRFDVNRDPFGAQTAREAASGADDLLRMRARPDRDQQALLQLPDALDCFVVAILARLCVDAIGGTAQRQFAQRDQIALAEKVRDRVCGLLGHVHLARLQTLDQIVGRQVDELHFVGLVEHAVGHRFRDADVRDLPNDVVEALEVLHVDGRVHVDTGGEQFLDVLPALRMARARRVAMREFVDQHQIGAAREHRIDVEFVQHRAAVLDAALRKYLEAVQQRFGVGAAMCLDHADDDVDTCGAHLARFGQHRVGLADAGARAEEDLQLTGSGTRLRALDFFQQFIGIGTSVGHRGSYG